MASEGEAHAASADVDAPAPVKGTGDGGTVCSSGGCGTAGAESCAASTKPAKRRARARLANQIPDSIMHNEQLSAAIAKVGGGVGDGGGIGGAGGGGDWGGLGGGIPGDGGNRHVPQVPKQHWCI